MTCPNCKIELACPCHSCITHRKEKGKMVFLLEEWFTDPETGTELVRCPICGFTQTFDFWEDFAFKEFEKLINEDEQ